MPTFETTNRFDKDWADLEPEDRLRFKEAVKQSFVPDLASGGRFRAGLRVKGVQGTDGVMEMTWAPNGRATWQYGNELNEGHRHIIWRRIGTHDIFPHPTATCDSNRDSTRAALDGAIAARVRRRFGGGGLA